MSRRRLGSQGPLLFCPKCNEKLGLEMGSLKFTRCERCNKIHQLLRCTSYECNYRDKICTTCNFSSLKEENEVTRTPENNVKSYKLMCAVSLISLIVLAFLYFYNSEMNQSINVSYLIKNLKKSYPSQKNETWYHFLSVLEQKIPTVKSITFLYSEDKRTSDCLMNELVSLYSKNKTLRSEEITFSNLGFEGGDYGLALEHYLDIVRKFRVFIADLSRVPGSLARIFHTLCDDVSSDIKPSLFIFTLKYDKKNGNLKPLEKATTLLQETWSDLPENELFPLLSRVVKNVVEIVPESQFPC